MRWVFYIVLTIELCNCTPKVYNYRFSKDGSQRSNRLVYKGDTLSVTIHFLFEGLMIDLKNSYHNDIKIDWVGVRLIVNDTAKKIAHVEFLSFSSNEIQLRYPPPVIPPRGATSDIIVNSDNIYYEKISEETKVMKVRSEYPREEADKETKEHVQKIKDYKFTVCIPVEIDHSSREFLFSFTLKVDSHRRNWALNALPI